jgi:trigger factor
MTVAVPADQVEKEVSSRLKRLSKQVKMAGFRPGKVPMKIVEAQYGGKVLQDVAGELIQSSFGEALGKEGLRPAGGPKIEPKSIDRGADLEYVATFEVYPEVKKLDLEGVSIERPTAQVGDEDIDRTLETMQIQRVQWNRVERAAKEGDRAQIDFTGSLDGENFEGGSAQDYQVVLGSETLLADFEKQLEGLKAGDEKTIDVPFPDDYRNSQLAGKTARFEVTVKGVEESELPPIDEDFAKGFGIESGKVEDLRAAIRENLERELEDRIRTTVRDRVMQALLDANPIEVPKALQDQEIDRLMESQRQTLVQHGASPDLAPTDREIYQEQAYRRVALGLILAEVANAHGIKPDAERVRAAVERLAQNYEDPQAFVRWHYADSKRLAEVQAVVLEELVVEKLLEKADIKETPVEFAELMYRKQAADK